MLIPFRVSVPRVIRKRSGKTWLTYEERLKKIEMMIRKNYKRIDERINDDIDHNKEVII